nr:MAG TPA: hypothetical protein [Caudoviricetes sp.]
MNKRKDDFKITFIINHLNNGEGKLSLECSKRNIKNTSLQEQLFFEVIKHVVSVVSKLDINDEYFDLEKFIQDNEKLTIKFIIDELKEN